MRLLGKILITLFFVIPAAYYFVSLNVDAFLTDYIEGRRGSVYSRWNYMFYVQVILNFIYAVVILFIPALMFVSEEKINMLKTKVKEFIRKL